MHRQRKTSSGKKGPFIVIMALKTGPIKIMDNSVGAGHQPALLFLVSKDFVQLVTLLSCIDNLL
jgi:hypothetical protein